MSISTIDWATVSSLATAGGTLILAIATFVSVRSANRSARAAEQSLLVGLRPVLMPSRLQDPPENVGFADGRLVKVLGGHAAAEMDANAIYLAMPLRNIGNGLAVLHGWFFYPERLLGSASHADLREFHLLSRDLYIPGGDIGFWQGAFRDPAEEPFNSAKAVITERRAFTIDLLYGDQDGGQRMVSRFAFIPLENEAWMASHARHWNLDRADPR